MTALPSSIDFFAEKDQPVDDIPRDYTGRALIIPPPGYDGPRRKDGLLAYSRASSFGKQLEDTYKLELWKLRQAVRGVELNRGLLDRIHEVGDPDADPSRKQSLNAVLDKVVEDAHEAAGSNVKSKLGTAIHYATELVDKGESLAELPPLLRERATAYWNFCRHAGIVPTSVEIFGVEDTYQVAGTWDRTGWWERKHKIVDVKTSSSMDFAGIGFAVQLATYARMFVYDHATGARTPHAVMDLDEGIIVHVDRNQGGPVHLYRVDIAAGWRFATLVNEIKEARNAGKRAIRRVDTSDPILLAIANAFTLDQLNAIYAQTGASWGAVHATAAKSVAAEIRGGR